MRIQIYIDIVKVKIFAAATPYTLFLHSTPPHYTHTHTHIDPLLPSARKGGVVKRVGTFPLLSAQPQSHMQCQYLYLLSMRVARKWRLPFVGFRPSPLPPLSTPSSSSMWFFFRTLFYDLGFMWALKQWLSVARLGHIHRVYYSAMKVFFLFYSLISAKACVTYIHLHVCVCVSDMSGKW